MLAMLSAPLMVCSSLPSMFDTSGTTVSETLLSAAMRGVTLRMVPRLV